MQNIQKAIAFVSSTVCDLIDIRSELEAEISGMGMVPILSDSASSDFRVPRDRDSIEACLVNVERSTHFVIVLDQRYGPTLGNSGFEDKSATHLEYLQAREIGLPIYMYTRVSKGQIPRASLATVNRFANTTKSRRRYHVDSTEDERWLLEGKNVRDQFPLRFGKTLSCHPWLPVKQGRKLLRYKPAK